MHILIIRPGAIGDTLLTFPILQALRIHYNQPHLTLVGNPTVLPLAMAFGLIDEVADYGQLQWSELFSIEGIQNTALKRQLEQIDLAICWMRDSDGIVAHNLREAGVKRVIVAPGRPPEGRRVHVVDYLAETVGLPDVRAQFIAPTFPQFVVPFHAGHTRGGDELRPNQRVAIHPGSGGAQKCWPVSSFAAIIKYLWQQNYPVLLLAGPADHKRVAELHKLLPGPPQAHMLHMLIDAPLLQVAQYLQQCRCYLGNDSGITHLAAMLAIPTIALFGPSDPAVWRPPGPSVDVIYKPMLAQLPVEIVIECLHQRL